ncbi:MAG TPA: hypothetical protein VF666_11495 [Pyrinomonadaceae bacterium]|jgi:hypothetical protein
MSDINPDNAKRHLLTVMLEDYFHVRAFGGLIQRGQWYRFQTRFEQNNRRPLLQRRTFAALSRQYTEQRRDWYETQSVQKPFAEPTSPTPSRYRDFNAPSLHQRVRPAVIGVAKIGVANLHTLCIIQPAAVTHISQTRRRVSCRLLHMSLWN